MVVLAASSTSRPTVPHNGVGPMCPRLNDGSKPRSGAGAGPDDPVWSRARTSSAPCSVSAARARLRLPTRSASSSTCRTSVARPVARSKAATSRRASISADACVASALEMSSPVCGGEGSAPPLPWSPSASNCTPHFKSGSKRVSVRAHARNSGGMQSGGRLFTWTTSKSAPTTQTHEWPMLTMSPAATCARTFQFKSKSIARAAAVIGPVCDAPGCCEKRKCKCMPSSADEFRRPRCSLKPVTSLPTSRYIFTPGRSDRSPFCTYLISLRKMSSAFETNTRWPGRSGSSMSAKRQKTSWRPRRMTLGSGHS
mmetsp:Transcript_14472/g.48473  ORF Transcript_14472/g.48473 Transcript_14472/m.48473 type:complete len:312 (-) Transcript_14472:79-1014(-)